MFPGAYFAEAYFTPYYFPPVLGAAPAAIWVSWIMADA